MRFATDCRSGLDFRITKHNPDLTRCLLSKFWYLKKELLYRLPQSLTWLNNMIKIIIIKLIRLLEKEKNN